MSTPMTPAQAAQQSNRTGGGQYKEKAYAEAQIELAPAQDDEPVGYEAYQQMKRKERFALMQRVASEMPDSLELVSIRDDDRLKDAQVDDLLDGRRDKVVEQLDNVFSEQRHNNAIDEAILVLDQSGILDDDLGWDELEGEDQDELRHAAYSRDTVDPLKTLADQTPILARMPLGDGPPLGTPETYSGAADNYEARVETVMERLRSAGIDTQGEHTRAAVEEIVAEGPYDWHDGVQVELMLGTHAGVVAPHVDAQREITVHNPMIALTDRYNGSGWEARLDTPVTVMIPSTEQALSSAEDVAAMRSIRRAGFERDGARGQSWAQTTGADWSEYTAEVDDPARAVPYLAATSAGRIDDQLVSQIAARRGAALAPGELTHDPHAGTWTLDRTGEDGQRQHQVWTPAQQGGQGQDAIGAALKLTPGTTSQYMRGLTQDHQIASEIRERQAAKQDLPEAQRLMRRRPQGVDLPLETMDPATLSRQVRAYENTHRAISLAHSELGTELGAFRIAGPESVEFYDRQGQPLKADAKTQQDFASRVDMEAEAISSNAEPSGMVSVADFQESLAANISLIGRSRSR